jgi:hypothetical protein
MESDDLDYGFKQKLVLVANGDVRELNELLDNGWIIANHILVDGNPLFVLQKLTKPLKPMTLPFAFNEGSGN